MKRARGTTCKSVAGRLAPRTHADVAARSVSVEGRLDAGLGLSSGQAAGVIDDLRPSSRSSSRRKYDDSRHEETTMTRLGDFLSE
jgi:hypothetical protein